MTFAPFTNLKAACRTRLIHWLLGPGVAREIEQLRTERDELRRAAAEAERLTEGVVRQGSILVAHMVEDLHFQIAHASRHKRLAMGDEGETLQ